MKKAKLKLRFFEWYSKINELLEPFEPEVMDVKINYKDRYSEVREKITINSNNIKQLRDLKIPKYENYKIKDIITSDFKSKTGLFSLLDNAYKCTDEELSDDESLLIIFEGKVNPEFINQLVRVQPASNRDQTEEIDRYWLEAIITDIEMWNDLWNPLEIEDVDVYVDVSLDRCFSVVLPTDIKARINATQGLLHAGKQTNKDAMNKAWWAYRRAVRDDPMTIEKVLQIGKRILEPDSFNDYVSVDKPYRIGSVEKTSVKRTLPEDITVTARTDLNNENYHAKGYLNFKKNDFIDIIRKELEKM